MTTTSPPRIAWIGLGNMGRGMASNILKKSPENTYSGPLQLFNRSPARSALFVQKHPEHSITIAESVAAATAAADIIFTCVGDDAAINSIFEAALAADAKGKLFVDCSTIHPDTTAALSAACEKSGARFVACPVFGAPAMADAGQLVSVPAGAPEDVKRVAPFLDGVMGRATLDFSGREPGTATHLKLVGNTFILAMVEAISEGLVLAETTGLGTDAVKQFLTTMFPGPYVAYADRMMSGDYHRREEPLFTAKLARKDAGHALKLAEKGGAQLKGLQVTKQHLEEVIQHMDDKGDIASVYGAVRQESGLKFENE